MRAITYSLLLIAGVAVAGCHTTGFGETRANAAGGFQVGVDQGDGYVPLRSTSTGGAASGGAGGGG